ncbi:MAG: ATP-binding protein [Cyanobacteria bacterium P01_H01_bin.130]
MTDAGSQHNQAITAELEKLRSQNLALKKRLLRYEKETNLQARQLAAALADSTRRAKALERSQEALDSLKTILERMGDGLLVVNTEGVVQFANPAALTLLGNVAIAEPLAVWVERCEFFVEEESGTLCPLKYFPLTRVLAGEPTAKAELWMNRPSPNAAKLQDSMTHHGQWVSIQASPLYSIAGQISGGVAIIRDVTTRKQAAELLLQSSMDAQEQAYELSQNLKELKQTQAQLIQTEKMASLGQLVAGVAHEINNPISFIYGNLAHLQDYVGALREVIEAYQQAVASDITPEDAQAKVKAASVLEKDIDLEFILADLPKVIESMHHGADRVRNIVRSLRQFSRLDETELKIVNLHDGIESTLAVLQSGLGEQNDIEVQKDYGNLPPVECYASQINQVFLEIIRNAIDALNARRGLQIALDSLADQENSNASLYRPRLTITTECLEGDRVAVRITDNGMGIDDEIRAKIFDPFFTTKPVGQGTGLGLSTCYQIVAINHNGQLHCLSATDRGSSFIVELPVRPFNIIPL